MKRTSILFILIQIVVVGLCNALLHLDFPPDYCENLDESKVFDFIVVGSGPGGSLVARRLSENTDWNILLLEAGDDPNDGVAVPGNVLLYTDAVANIPSWNYSNNPSENYCRGATKGRCNLRQVKVLGGNSQVNFMIYNRGQKSDYDNWAKLGNHLWSYDQCHDYFKKTENYLAHSISKSLTRKTVSKKYHRKGGHMTISLFGKNPAFKTLRKSLVKGLKDLGLSETNDFLERPTGFAKNPVFADENGYRYSSARAFLTNIPENLKVCKNAQVDKVNLNGFVAKSVTFTHKKLGVVTIKVKKEVIISAGVYSSPGILERSGIGNPKHLRKAGIQLKHYLPGVGENLQDHFIAVGNVWGVNLPIEGLANLQTTGLLDLVAQLHSRDINAEEADTQIMFTSCPRISFVASPVYENEFNFGKPIFREIIYQENSPALVMISPAILRRDTVGSVHVVSKCNDPPSIDFNVYSRKSEIDHMVRGLEYAEIIANSEAMKKFTPKQIIYPSCYKEAGNSSSNYLYKACLAKTISISFFHGTGTCKMGPISDPNAVVNQYLQVHGIKNLRVIDASIMPNITRGNVEAPILMIAERGADFIKSKWQRNFLG